MEASWTVRPACPEEWNAALAVQFSPLEEPRRTEVLADALAAAESGSLDLSRLLVAERDGHIGAAALVTMLPDGVGVTWPTASTLSDPVERAAAQSVVLRGVIAEFQREEVVWGQCLADCSEPWDTAALKRAGFQPGGTLSFLARGLRDLPDSPVTPELTWEEYDPERNGERFVRALEETYRGSIDCPLINGLRTGLEALASHRLSGEFTPAWWRLYKSGHRDAAILLLGDHPDQSAVELVYVGVAPDARGSGLGRRLIQEGLFVARERGRSALFLAVDEQNSFAVRVYEDLGFVQLARRELFLWLRSSSARE